MSWLALGDSDDLQCRMRVSCSFGQIRDCCSCRAAAVTSSLDNLHAAALCARLLFMAPVAIGSSGWRTTAAACAPLHYIARGGFCWWRTAAAPGGPLLLLLAAHCCYSWQRTAFSFLPR
ncbi:unnamed protein product [Closterium sp. NIES-64]|nr:unnamed protein product [Closterium sp. NIES-64]